MRSRLIPWVWWAITGLTTKQASKGGT
ncbi:protein of unknown function [Hyphomicrobium sp. 1Nfss2.1]